MSVCREQFAIKGFGDIGGVRQFTDGTFAVMSVLKGRVLTPIQDMITRNAPRVTIARGITERTAKFIADYMSSMQAKPAHAVAQRVSRRSVRDMRS